MTDIPTWLDADAIARMLSCSARQVRERLACRPDFPKPVRISGIARPRWRSDEVATWIEHMRTNPRGGGAGDEHRVGRRRKAVDV